MKNWSTDTSDLQKNPEKFSIWRLEQLINFGLGKRKKLDLDELRKYWGVARIDPFKRKFLSLLYESRTKLELCFNPYFTINSLIENAQIKFDNYIDPIQLGAQYVKAKELKDYPRMLEKIDEKSVAGYFY